MVSVHARLRAADAFLEAAARAADPEARDLLERLCLLFLLEQLGEHTGDLLADGHLSREQVRALPQLLDDVLRDLAPHMTDLVAAFDLPAAYLDGIPLANSGRVSLGPCLARGLRHRGRVAGGLRRPAAHGVPCGRHCPPGPWRVVAIAVFACP